MTTDDLKQTNVGRAVLIDSLNGFNDARATFRAWSKDKKTAIVSLDSTYGRLPKVNRRPGRLLTTGSLVEVSIGNARFAPKKK